MYEAFFGVRQRPFELTPNPRFLVPTRAHAEALANLEYGIASGKGITLLVGDAGTGKTTLIRTALERQRERTHCVDLHNPALTREEFVELLAVRFGLSAHARESKAAFLVELEDLLRQRRARPEPETTVLIVDEAQSLPYELLEEIRLLANIETNEEKLLSVILAGQPELADRLNDQSLRQLKQRIALRCSLQALTVQETATYLAGRIRAAGGTAAHVFTQEAVATIHDRARGIPRAINVLADNALLTAFAMQKRPVTRQIVLDVSSDFDLREQEAPLPSEAPQTAAVAAAPVAAQPAAAPPTAAQPAAQAPAAGRLLRLEPASNVVPFDGAGHAASATTAGSATTDTPESAATTAPASGSLFDAVVKRRRFSLF